MILHEKIHFIGKLPEETWTNNQDGEDLLREERLKERWCVLTRNQLFRKYKKCKSKYSNKLRTCFQFIT